MAYSRKDSGTSRELYGNYILKSGFAHRVYAVRSAGKNRPTEFRVFPAVDPDDGAFVEQVAAVDGNPLGGISDAFHAAEIVSFQGKNKLQYICDTSDFPHSQSPSRKFYNGIHNFVTEEGKKANPEWTTWATWKGGLQLPACVMLMQGVLLRLNGDLCTKKTGEVIQIAPVVLCLNRSSTKDMEKKLTTPANEAQELSANNSQLGDITSPDKGKTLLVYAEIEEEKKRYAVEASDKVMRLKPDYVRATFVPWVKLLHVGTAAEQMEHLADTFSLAAVQYVFREDPDYAQFIPNAPKKTISTPPPAKVAVRAVPAPAAPAAPVEEPEADDTSFAIPDDAADIPPMDDDLPMTTNTVVPAAPKAAPVVDNPSGQAQLNLDDLVENPVMRALLQEKMAAQAKKKAQNT